MELDCNTIENNYNFRIKNKYNRIKSYQNILTVSNHNRIFAYQNVSKWITAYIILN